MHTQPIDMSARWTRRPAGFRFLAFAAALGAALTASAEKLAFLGTTDKDPLQYALNETITFTVTLAPATTARWTAAAPPRATRPSSSPPPSPRPASCA